MPKIKKKIVVDVDNPTRVTKEEVTIALNNSVALSYNYLDTYLKDAESQIKVNGDRRKLKRLSPRVMNSYIVELTKPLLEMVHERLILKEELVVALAAAAQMVDQYEVK